MISTTDLEKNCQPLLIKAGLSPSILSITPCAFGGNNRIYRVETSDGIFAVKKYFRQADDPRDRLAAEFAFLSYAQKAAPHWTPKIYSDDTETGMALYEFISGHPIKAGDLSASDIQQASDFFCALNDVYIKQQAVELPFASEARFSIEDHLNLVGNRIANLERVLPELHDDALAQQTIHELSTQWQTVLHAVYRKADEQGIDITAVLDMTERCISPSDFGFHNALKTSEGRICFLDFEYAGWDDPAKMIGDFFSQLAVPVPVMYFESFIQQVLMPFSQMNHLAQRAKLLRSVCQIKWCCIALNIFIPVNLARRQFANPHLNVQELKKAQLGKARVLLKQIHDSGLPS